MPTNNSWTILSIKVFWNKHRMQFLPVCARNCTPQKLSSFGAGSKPTQNKQDQIEQVLVPWEHDPLTTLLVLVNYISINSKGVHMFYNTLAFVLFKIADKLPRSWHLHSGCPHEHWITWIADCRQVAWWSFIFASKKRRGNTTLMSLWNALACCRAVCQWQLGFKKAAHANFFQFQTHSFPKNSLLSALSEVSPYLAKYSFIMSHGWEKRHKMALIGRKSLEFWMVRGDKFVALEELLN